MTPDLIRRLSKARRRLIDAESLGREERLSIARLIDEVIESEKGVKL